VLSFASPKLWCSIYLADNTIKIIKDVADTVLKVLWVTRNAEGKLVEAEEAKWSYNRLLEGAT